VGSAEQLPFSLPHVMADGGEDFFVTPVNMEAVGRLDAWPEWSHHALFLVGAPGSGKSHLANVWRTRTGARMLDERALRDEGFLKDGKRSPILIEDIDRLLSTGDTDLERGLFHLFNWVKESGGTLLMTARAPVSVWAPGLADLRSRLLATPIAQLGGPDDILLEAVMVKQFSDRQMKVPPEVVRFAIARLERSFAAVREFVEAVDRASLSAKRPVTVPLVRDILDRPQEKHERLS